MPMWQRHALALRNCGLTALVSGRRAYKCRASGNFRKPPIPSRARIVTLLAVKRQAALTASITNFFGGFIPVCRAFKFFWRQRNKISAHSCPRYIFLINTVLAAAFSMMAPARYRPYDRGGPSSGPDGDRYVLGSQQPGAQVPGRRHMWRVRARRAGSGARIPRGRHPGGELPDRPGAAL